MEKKYELLKDDTVVLWGETLFRIRAVKDFANVKQGELGGYIEKEDNLSHYDNAWVYSNAEVCENARVYGNAEVSGNALVYGNAEVCENARVTGNALVCGDAEVYGNAEVCGNTEVYGNAEVCENARVTGNALVCGDAEVCGNAEVCENVRVTGNALVCGDAVIKSSSDYIVFKNTWSSFRWFTYTASNKMWSVGCFYGTGEELIEKAYQDSEKSGKCYEAYVNLVSELEGRR